MPAFSGSIWENASYCTGIFGTELFTIEIPENIEQLQELYGEGAVWQEALNGEEAYYQYVFDDNIEVRFHVTPEGTRLTGTILIKLADTENLNGGIDFVETDYHNPEYQPPALRDKAEWQNLNRYTLYLDKTLEDIVVDFPKLEYLTEFGYYEDSDSGVDFFFSGNLCDRICIPTPLMFSDMGSQMTRARLVEYWTENHTWFSQEGCAYVYEFEDVSVFVYSNIDGSVPNDYYIDIIKSVYL